MSKDIKDFLQGVDNADAVAKIISDNLKDAKCKLFIDDGEKNIFVPKSRLDAKIGELNTATQTITTLNASIKTLEAQVKDDDKAKETIQSLQTDLDNYKKALKDSQIDSALQLCAVENKAHDAKDLKGFLDMGKISIGENGEVIGIKEQVENLKKKKHTYLKLVNLNLNNKMEKIHSMVQVCQVNKLVALYSIHKQHNLEISAKC